MTARISSVVVKLSMDRIVLDKVLARQNRNIGLKLFLQGLTRAPRTQYVMDFR